MNRIFRITGIAVLLTTLSAVTTAAGWVADFSLDANATYDDNFLMNDQDQESWIYTLKPEASLIYASPVMTSELQTSLALKRYSEFDQFDSEDPAFDWKNSYQRERSTWSLDFGYSENSQRDLAEDDTGQFDSNSIVETTYANSGVSYRITEKDDLGISLSLTERDYDQDNFFENDNQTVSINWQRKVNQALSTTLTVSSSQYSAERASISNIETDYERATVGFIYRYSEGTTISGSTGYFQSDSREVIGQPAVLIVETDNTGLLLNLSVDHKQQKNKWSLNLSRSLYPSSQGNVEERDSASGSFERELSGRSSAGISFTWHETSFEAAGRESINISPYYHYRLTERLKLQTSYIFRSFDRQISEEVESNRAKIGLRYDF